MPGFVAVIFGFVALIAITIAVVVYIIRSAIREADSRESRLAEVDRKDSVGRLDDRSSGSETG